MRRGSQQLLSHLARGLTAASKETFVQAYYPQALQQFALSTSAVHEGCSTRALLHPGTSTGLGWGQQHKPFQNTMQVQTRGMFIQTQPTPNPHSLMFLPGQKVMESGSHEFPNARAGMSSPLAKRLFTIDGVATVFFGSEFITITKKEDVSWAVLKPQVFEAIMDHVGSGAPLFYDQEALARDDTAIHEDDDEVVAMIKELLETRIRPAVQEDGGDITFRGFDPDSGTVTVKMMGACSGCPSSTVTLKSGIENMLMHYIPEVKHVIEDSDEADSDSSTASSSNEVKDSPLAAHLSN